MDVGQNQRLPSMSSFLTSKSGPWKPRLPEPTQTLVGAHQQLVLIKLAWRLLIHKNL